MQCHRQGGGGSQDLSLLGRRGGASQQSRGPPSPPPITEGQSLVLMAGLGQGGVSTCPPRRPRAPRQRRQNLQPPPAPQHSREGCGPVTSLPFALWRLFCFPSFPRKGLFRKSLQPRSQLPCAKGKGGTGRVWPGRGCGLQGGEGPGCGRKRLEQLCAWQLLALGSQGTREERAMGGARGGLSQT